MYNGVRIAYTNKSKSLGADEIDDAEISGFPPLVSPAKYLSAIFPPSWVVLLIHTLAIIAIQNANFGIDISLNCYLAGRFTGFPINLSKFLSLCIIFLIAWYVYIYLYQKQLKLDVFPFLLRRARDGHDSQLVMDQQISEPSDSYMRNVTCMAFVPQDQQSGNKPTYYLRRPNRTPESKRKLHRFIGLLSLVYLTGAFFALIIFTPVIIWGGLTDYLYLKAYPTCSPELEQLAAAGQANYFTMHFVSKHRVIITCLDIIHSLKILIDIVSALTFPAIMILTLAYDLEIYWEAIRRELEKLSAEYKLHHMVDLYDRSQCKSDQFYAATTGHQALTLAWHFDRDCRYESEKERNPELKVQIIQRQILDFFSLLDTYDKIVSAWISNACLVWLAIFGSTSYQIFYSQDPNYILLLRAFQCASVILIAGPVTYLMRIAGVTSSTYPMICALMAYERVWWSRTVWEKILDFYTYKANKHGFSLLLHPQMTWMFLFHLVCTTLSAVITIETLKVNRQS